MLVYTYKQTKESKMFYLMILTALTSFLFAYLYGKRQAIKEAFKRDIF